MAWPDDQPKQDSGGERDPAERKKPGLRGLYLSLRPGPLWKRDALSDGVPIGQGGGAPQGADAGAGWTEAVLRAPERTGWGSEPRSEERRVGKECRSRWGAWQ